MKVKKAIIPAAGLGTRFLPATKAQPKEMLPLVDKPSIQYIIEEAVASGIEDILIITGRGKRAIEDHFDRSYELEKELLRKNQKELHQQMRAISEIANIYYVRQKEALGLGYAIYQGRNFIGNEPFAILLGDDVVRSSIPCTRQLMDCYQKYHNPIIGIQHVTPAEVSSYGIVAGQQIEERVHLLEKLVEKPAPEEAPSNLAVMGRYIVTPDIFPILETLPPGKNGEIQLTDALALLGKDRRLLAYRFQGERYDIGSRFGYIRATIDFALEREDLKEPLMDYLASLTQKNSSFSEEV